MTEIIDPMQPVPSSAIRHVQRLQERDAERAAGRASTEPDTRPTHERLAEPAIAGARADQMLREEALKRERLARGEWVPGDDEDTDEEGEEAEPEEARDPMDSPERRSARVAWNNATR
ncbi:hypothetical protein R6V09_01090 [Streptomyces sp. W16]|uniref:hypothetical protein n=1 Tax=Streptomyces sp. W16 TaxID=3076631 RepID=UPI00295B2875|nr:hypothetical protein [Streptomyces sp. W16]MDV9168738.1 hypothetical protein [Streptomyces sp. W16]